MIKRIFKAIGCVFVKIWHFFAPLSVPPVNTKYCVHCGFEYPYDTLTQKTVKKEGNDGRYVFYYLYLCPDCISADSRFHHTEFTRGSWVQFFWEDGEGNIYEFDPLKKCAHCNFKHPRDYLAKKTIKKHDGQGYSEYILYLCPACIFINPKFHHAETVGDSGARFFWEDDEGKVYEFYEFKENGNNHKTNRETD